MENFTEINPSHSMDIFPWNQFFEVGIDEIDRQHKNLVGMINDICRSSMSGKSQSFLDKLFQDMLDYTRNHFSFEENYYKINKVPNHLLEDHKKLHDGFVYEIMS